ncbi:cuticular protein, putative [Ixodes scapularis]|uniref:Cuticular protein, putative n=1 Tax=Ixodes scapularis TaxID=6945 RepID=B7PXB3_IXOSC|nr:cuticular protein, putative [Ixodes scapularis]|eukprot:XP_002400048.1 cuticular protein, putative [Ixodes scapularis]
MLAKPSVPFSFGYDMVDEFGTRLFHKEDADASNSRTGSYGYTDPSGLFRRVNYVADAGGFRATVETNEPGTAPGQSADAVFNANPVVSGQGLRAPGAFGASAYGTAAAPAYGYGGKYGYAKDPYVRLGYAREGVSSQDEAQDEVYYPDEQRQRIKQSSRALLMTSLPKESNPIPASRAGGLRCTMEESAPNLLHSGKAGELEDVKCPLVTM